jgi:hypothetical protein
MQPSPFRLEVRQFVLAAETLISPALMDSDLTPDECDIIAYYVMTLSNAKHPWAKDLTVRYA